ncbi:hypothetical protein V7148_03800 [Gottfriedia acidiceleris]|uniref:hypothetical protein n=1 Tax=Bacillaceae TaxID=186817 RepID=UPI000BED2A91|nr:MULTISPECIES: hypothetical protein [unclassified Bacillus (in: firmicutes)]PEC47719.1 hypothetical protein CON00_20115 [Bacillus sp. AFS096315]PFM83029.1 hypothetical protein COJ46_04305 [Bacillus sp. AFS077874]
MKINNYMLQLSLLIIIIFGGTFIIHLMKTGEFLIDQIIGFSVGILILFFTLIWRKSSKLS